MHDSLRPRRDREELKTKPKFEHKRSLGQNFLTSDVVPNWMVEAAKVTKGEIVLEIGPGTGMLTKALLAKGAQIIAIEADERAIQHLQTDFAAAISTKQLIIYHGDAREITPQTLGLKDHHFKVVANIPYYLSGFLLRNLLETTVQPSLITFLIQKELATRIARDKKESLLALSVKAFGQPIYNKNVGRGHFYPIPKVDSAILTVENINRDNFQKIEMALFFEILHLGLGKKRKQLLTNLTEKYSREFLQQIFTKLGISLQARGEDLNMSTWLQLVEQLQKSNPQTINS